MPRRSRPSPAWPTALVVLALAVLALAAGAAAAAPPLEPDQLLRTWTNAVADRGIAVPAASYEVVIGNWKGLPGRSWIDVADHRIYLSPEVDRDAQDPRFPQGRRDMRLQLLHELGHGLDAELTDADRGGYAAIMNDYRPWFPANEDQVDTEQPPNERFAVAYASVAAGLRYDRLRPDYGFRPTRAQYRRLAGYFHTLDGRAGS